MLGGLGAYIASEISGSVRRNVTIFALYGLAGLLIVCAAGYGLHAVHTVLTFHYGSIAASLWIGGGLLLAGLISIGFASYVKNRPKPSRPLATSALVAAPIAAKLMGSRMGWKSAMVGGIVVLGAVLGRQFFKGDDADSA